MKPRKLLLSQPETVEVFKALASETRARILAALADAPMNVSALGELLGISQSATTKHVQQLEEADLITFEHRPGTQGTQKVCSLRDGLLSVYLAPPLRPIVEKASLASTATEIVEAAGLTVLAPSMEGQVRAEDTLLPVQMLFVNNTSSPYERYWLNFDGEREDYGTIMPSTVVSQTSWSNHPWLIAPVDGPPIGIFVTGPHVGCIVIGPSIPTRPAWLDEMSRQPDAALEIRELASASAA